MHGSNFKYKLERIINNKNIPADKEISVDIPNTESKVLMKKAIEADWAFDTSGWWISMFYYEDQKKQSFQAWNEVIVPAFTNKFTKI